MSLIDRCKQIDIVDFARNNGMAVVNKGRDYRLEDHDSFVFDRRKQRFYWNSQNISGDIIELAKLFFIDKEIQDSKQQFKAATDFILKNEDKTERVENLHFETEKYKDHPVDYQPLTEKGRNYLKDERKLPEWLIDYAEKEGLVLPVFYRVNPSDVRHHRGSFGEALANHEKKSNSNNMEKLETWKMALHQVSNISGHHFQHDGYVPFLTYFILNSLILTCLITL